MRAGSDPGVVNLGLIMGGQGVGSDLCLSERGVRVAVHGGKKDRKSF